MIVVDASVVLSAVSDDSVHGDDVRARLRSDSLTAPHVLDLEVASGLRRIARRGELEPSRAALAVRDLPGLPITRVAHGGLLARAWSLRDNLTIYDAVYVALAELLDVPLVTSDARLAASPGIRCEVEVLSASA